MTTETPGNETLDIIGGFPKAPSDRSKDESTTWDIQVPSEAVPAPETPRRAGYSFGSTMGSFTYSKQPQTAFGIDESDRRSGSSWTSPVRTPRASAADATMTQQRSQRDTPPHMKEDATPPGLNQTNLPFDSTLNPVTSTVQNRSKEVLRLPQATRKTTSIQVNDGRPVESVKVEPWTAIDGPLKGILQDTRCYSKVIVEFFGSMDAAVLQDYPIYSKELWNRRNEALKIGKTYLLQRKQVNSNTDSDNTLTAKERGDMAPMLKELNELLTCLDRYEDEYFIGYKMEKTRFQEFNKGLFEIRTVAKDHLIMSGAGIPDLPCWGLDGNINEYWEGNDFEILATCYRHEVVQYLTRITRIVDSVIPMIRSVTEKVERLEVPQSKEDTSAAKDSANTTKEKSESAPMFHNAPTPIAQRVQNFTNQNASIFGNPSKHTSSRKLADMLSSNRSMIPKEDAGGSKTTETERKGKKNSPTKDKSANNGERGSAPPIPPKKNGNAEGGTGGDDDPGDSTTATATTGNTSSGRGIAIPQFDHKLKVDMIPTWDGNPDDLGRWILKVNRLSERSPTVFQQLGYLTPTRLTGAAELWYYSQSAETRAKIEENWGTLRSTIAGYYMNRSFLEKQRVRANKARYRDPAHLNETPSEYFIRKLELLEIVYNYSEGELINEIMAGAPTYWSTVLTPHLYDNIEGFQMAVKFQEDNLLRMGYDTYRVRQEYGISSSRDNSRNPFTSYKNKTSDAKVNAVGWSAASSNPAFPKDDANVSPRGTPVSKGGRPCRHCGSDNHWDPECKYARKGEKKARVNAVTISIEDQRAQQEYDELFYSTISDDSDEEDF